MFKLASVILLSLLICGNAAAGPDAEQLILGYFRDCGQFRNNGKFEALEEFYHPYYSKDVFALPSGLYGGIGGMVNDEKEKKRYYSRMAGKYGINFNSWAKEYNYNALRGFYDGEKKRKDLAVLDKESFSQLLKGKTVFEKAPFEKYYYNGSNKVTAILDQGINKKDPQVAISPGGLQLLKVQQIGKVRTTTKAAKVMTDLVELGKYTISGEMTQDGYLATAIANDNTIAFTKLELLFSEKDGRYLLKKTRQYFLGSLLEEETFDDYIVTADGSLLPTKMIRRKYAPYPALYGGDTPQLKLAYEKKITVLNADFNTDIPEDTFIPIIPYGYTVFDTTVEPHIQYKANRLEDSYGRDFFETPFVGLEDIDNEPIAKTPTPQDAMSGSNEANTGDVVIENKPKAKIKRTRLPWFFWVLIILVLISPPLSIPIPWALSRQGGRLIG